MTGSGINALHERARAGDPGALTALGKRLLIGDGVRQAPEEAVACMSKAAALGSGEATAHLALFAGWGVLRPRNLDDALDQLQRAAELGWGPSQRELQFLARGTGTDWRALRQQVDIAQWTQAPAIRVVSKAPKICVIDGFASSAECDWLIERGRHNLKRAMVYRRDAGGHSAVQRRTNTEADFTVVNADLVLSLVRDRIAAAIGVATPFFEVTKLLHYEPGQHFALHADFLEPSTPALAREVEQHGQRVMSFLTYLNDDYEGGETDFPRIGYRYKGGRGDALLFANVDVSELPTTTRFTRACRPPAGKAGGSTARIGAYFAVGGAP
jgi:prolyl 4-hydroxylase